MWTASARFYTANPKATTHDQAEIETTREEDGRENSMNIAHLILLVKGRMEVLRGELGATPSASHMASLIRGELDGLQWVLDELEQESGREP